MILFSIAFFISSVSVILLFGLKGRRNFIYSTLYTFSVVYFSFYFIVDYLTGKGFDESVIYHLTTGFKGAGVSEFSSLIYFSVLGLMISVIVLVFILLGRSILGKSLSNRGFYFANFLIALSVCFNPLTEDLREIYIDPVVLSFLEPSDGLDSFVVVEALESTQTPKNLIFIYLESFESTYQDKLVFPNLTPNLDRYEHDSLAFKNVKQANSTGWTIAGMVASQCGLPLITPKGSENLMGGADRFLPNAVCMGDLLSDYGYNLSFIGGADIEFAGKGNFYKTHSFDSIKGKNELLNEHKDLNMSAWGVYDDDLFDILINEYVELSNRNQPFALFGLTLDTHHPSGHVSEQCDDLVFGDGSNPMLNAIACSDQLVFQFVERLRNHPAFNNTLVVLASDHLAMPNTASELLNSLDRKNLFLVLNSDEEPIYDQEETTTFDIAPTVLSLMGFDNVAGLGLGRNLVSAGVHSLGLEIVDEIILKKRAFFKSFWSFPNLRGGLYFDGVKKELLINDTNMKMPVLVTLNGNLDISNTYFGHVTDRYLIDKVIELDRETFLIAADNSLLRNYFEGIDDSLGYSLVYGSKSEGLETISLNGNQSVNPFNPSFWSKKPEATPVLGKNMAFENLQKYGVPNVFYSEDERFKDISVLSSSVPYLPSYVQDKLGVKQSLKRGLTVFTVESGRLHEEAVLDICASDEVSDNNFKERLSTLVKNDSPLLFVANDSVICTTMGLDMKNLLSSYGLSELSNIGFRKPYLSIVSKGKVTEIYNSSIGSLLWTSE